MLLAFHSKATGDVLMLDHHAQPVLQAAGKDVANGVPERGIFAVDQLAGAIAGIEQAIAEPAVQDASQDDEETKTPAMAQAVSLRQRAYPLLDMLRRAQAKGVEVLWEPAANW